jgi:ADP-heptose:LPS heptosyltransferase
MKILVIRLREIGDTILLTPMLRQLKHLHPGSTLDVVCEDRNAAVLIHNPNIERLIRLPRKANAWEFLRFAHRLRREKYDLVVDSQSMPKTALLTRLTGGKSRLGFKNRWLRNRLCYTAPLIKDRLQYTAISNLQLLQDPRVDWTDERLEVYADSESEMAAASIMQLAQGQPVIAINPVTRFVERQWSLDAYGTIADRLSDAGYRIMMLYGPGERNIADQVAQRMTHSCLLDYAMPSLLELRCILSKCVMYIGNDGGPKHMAIAAGIPTVTVFGHSPDPWTPWANPMHRVVACALSGSSIRAWGEVVQHAPSIQAIPTENVWRQVNESLQHRKQAA